MLRHLNQTEMDNLKASNISEQQWPEYYEQLWTHDQLEETICADISDCVHPVTMDELLVALHGSKNRKAPGTDGLNMEHQSCCMIVCCSSLIYAEPLVCY